MRLFRCSENDECSPRSFTRSMKQDLASYLSRKLASTRHRPSAAWCPDLDQIQAGKESMPPAAYGRRDSKMAKSSHKTPSVKHMAVPSLPRGHRWIRPSGALNLRTCAPKRCRSRSGYEDMCNPEIHELSAEPLGDA